MKLRSGKNKERYTMYDEQLLIAKKALERQKYTNLKTGIYVDDELIEFDKRLLKELKISIIVPESFVSMPDKIKNIKYPSQNAPAVLLMNLDTIVNFGFNLLPNSLKDGELEILSQKYQLAIKNINPSILFDESVEGKTEEGNEMRWSDFKSYSIDGQSYNRMVFVRMRHFVIQGIFNCPDQDKMKWSTIAEQVFKTMKEEVV